MAWLWRKSKNSGPIRTIISNKGLGTSFGFLGFRFGVSPNGRKFLSFGIPGSGLYFIKHL